MRPPTIKRKLTASNRLFSNFVSLFLLQGVNYLLPLITVPYLVRVLGISNYGLLAFATAITAYFNIVVDYGFNLTATKEVATNRNDTTVLSEIYSSVLSVKLTLVILSFSIFSFIILFFDAFNNNIAIYFLSFGSVVGQAMFPIWFFQGMERMKYITFLTILSKSIFTASIFFFINNPSDTYKVPLIMSIGMISAGTISLYIVKKHFDIQLTWKPYVLQKTYFIDGWGVFVSRVFVTLYTSTNTLLLGLFSNTTIVGYYTVAEKIVGAAGGLFNPANQALYPYMAKTFSDGNNVKFNALIKKVSSIFLLTSTSLFLLFYALGDTLLILITGGDYSGSYLIYHILVITIITSPFGALYTQTLLIRKQNKEFNAIVRYTFMFNMLISPPLIYFYYGVGVSIAMVFSQLFVIILCTIAVKKGQIS